MFRFLHTDWKNVDDESISQTLIKQIINDQSTCILLDTHVYHIPLQCKFYNVHLFTAQNCYIQSFSLYLIKMLNSKKH